MKTTRKVICPSGRGAHPTLVTQGFAGPACCGLVGARLGIIKKRRHPQAYMGVSNAPHSTAECISNHETASNSFVRRTRSQARLRYSRQRQVAETGIWGIMKKIVLATVLAALGSASALAADLGPRAYTKAPMMTAPVSSWQGFYIGGNVGYGWGDNTADINFVPAGSGLVDQSLGAHSKSVVGGVQVGYNFQWERMIFGLETDIQGSGIKSSASVAPLAGASGAAGGDPTFASTDQKMSWFGTARARLGLLVTPDLLLYGTGGAAYGGIKITTDGIISPVNLDHLLGSLDKTKLGWTAGAGAEWMFTRGWSAKVEYLYLDLGSATAFGPQGAKTDLGANYTWSFKENIVRAGVNYHF
jgi:outer membrane immunogenic protein